MYNFLLQSTTAADDVTDSPCTVEGGESEGKDCSFRDFMTGKLQGYVSGYTIGSKQLVKSYLKAYRYGESSDSYLSTKPQ